MVGKRLVVVAWAAAGVAWAGRAAWGAEFLVHDATEVTAAEGSARPGDVIVMADGVWTDQKITLSASGSAAAGGEITLRAQTPGRVVLTGKSTLTISGDYDVADGLVFKDGTLYVMEAEDFTAVRDPNGSGGTWGVVAEAGASGGKVLKAPGGGRTDITGAGSVQDAVAEYDVAVNDAGTYYLYALARGADSSSNSFYVPGELGEEPTVARSVSEDGEWAWVEVGTYVVGAGEVNEPLTLEIGKRERGVELDEMILSPVRLTLGVPEPGGVGMVMWVGALGGRRRWRSAEC